MNEKDQPTRGSGATGTSHVCTYSTYYEEYYGERVMDGWPPRCSLCGRFMKWPPPTNNKATNFEELFV
jgi:hypothetical protein